MPAPKSRRTKSSRNKRRMHIYLPEKGLVACGNCGAQKLPHRVCRACGYYKGRPVLEVEREGQEKKNTKQEEGGGGGPLNLRKLSQR